MVKRQFSLQNYTLKLIVYAYLKTKYNLSKRFIETMINVNKDANIGINLNHSWDVDIESVSGNQGSLFLILICNQKIDRG